MSPDFRQGAAFGIAIGVLAAFLVIIPLIGAFGKLFAGETVLTLGFTNHVKDKRYCEVSPGVFRQWRGEDWRAFLGAQQNSHCEASAVGGAAWLPLHYRRFSAGVFGAGTTGYPERQITPGGGLAVAYDHKKEGVDLIWIPKVLVHLRWRWSFE